MITLVPATATPTTILAMSTPVQETVTVITHVTLNILVPVNALVTITSPFTTHALMSTPVLATAPGTTLTNILAGLIDDLKKQ